MLDSTQLTTASPASLRKVDSASLVNAVAKRGIACLHSPVAACTSARNTGACASFDCSNRLRASAYRPAWKASIPRIRASSASKGGRRASRRLMTRIVQNQIEAVEAAPVFALEIAERDQGRLSGRQRRQPGDSLGRIVGDRDRSSGSRKLRQQHKDQCRHLESTSRSAGRSRFPGLPVQNRIRLFRFSNFSESTPGTAPNSVKLAKGCC